VTNVQRVDTDRRLLGNPHGEDTAGLKPAFITLDHVRRSGRGSVPAGWIVESTRPLTSEEIADARELADDVGLTIEVQREDSSNAWIVSIKRC